MQLGIDRLDWVGVLKDFQTRISDKIIRTPSSYPHDGRRSIPTSLPHFTLI